MTAPSLNDFAHVRLSKHERAIVGLLVEKYPVPVAFRDILQAVFADKPCRQEVSSAHHKLGRLRAKMVGSGWRLPSVKRGASLPGQYRLERET